MSIKHPPMSQVSKSDTERNTAKTGFGMIVLGSETFFGNARVIFVARCNRFTCSPFFFFFFFIYSPFVHFIHLFSIMLFVALRLLPYRHVHTYEYESSPKMRKLSQFIAL